MIMGKVIIQNETVKNPITLIGRQAGICYGADITNDEKNFKRGLDCLAANHGRTLEFPDVYMVLDGYSARVIREWYTHIGGAPTRLQASTRYIKYWKGFDYITPPSIFADPYTNDVYKDCMEYIRICAEKLHEAEKLLMEELPVVPVITMQNAYMSQKLSGFSFDYFGCPEFTQLKLKNYELYTLAEEKEK